MRTTRLLLVGALAPIAFATPAFAGSGSAVAPAEIVAAAGDAPHSTGTTVRTETRVRRTVALGPEGTDERGRVGRIHTVVRGDTLWDISETYLGTPWVWPTIWRENPRVANPNRIYPGNRLWIAPGEMRQLSDSEATSMRLREQPPASGGDASSLPLRIQGVPSMQQIGFIETGVLETAGVILDSPEREKMLAAHRRAFVSLGEGQVEVGDRFTIVRENERVRDPETNKVIGVHIDRLGWLEITKVGLESSDAMIRESYDDILRGDRLMPRVAPITDVAVTRLQGPIEGQIALHPHERSLTGHYDIVFLNRGTDHGLDTGNMLEVYNPGAIAEDRETRVKHRLPDEVVANMVVVAAQPTTSVAYVTHATTELLRGALFRGADGESSSFADQAGGPLDPTQWTARTIESGRTTNAPASVPAKIAPKKSR